MKIDKFLRCFEKLMSLSVKFAFILIAVLLTFVMFNLIFELGREYQRMQDTSIPARSEKIQNEPIGEKMDLFLFEIPMNDMEEFNLDEVQEEPEVESTEKFY